MNKVLVIGASGHAKVIIDIIELQNKYEIVGLIDSFKEIGKTIYDYKVLGTEKDLPKLIEAHNIHGGIIAIGDNWTRMNIYNEIAAHTSNFNFIKAIHPSAVIGKNVSIGPGTAIMAGVVVNSDAKIGKQCIVNTKSSVGHDTVLKDFSSVAPGVSIGGDVKLGKCSAISLGANVIERVKIGKHTVIGAGALVNKDIASNKIAYGIPAKETKKRNLHEKYLGLTKTKNTKSYKLEFFRIEQNTDIERYNTLLKSFQGYSTFYSLEYYNYSPNKILCVFVLKKKDSPVALLPMYLNPIEALDNGNTPYYDAISPYGYSGPLFSSGIKHNEKIIFWKKIDDWYLRNNVVTEFIRFSLNENHKLYSGQLIPSLCNVKGKLDDFDNIWNNFKQKVRNNYRKAQKSGLEIKIYAENKSADIIDEFYNIYISTMQRNNASEIYFYDKTYFKNLIERHQENTVVATVYKDDIAISTELIIIDNNELYSYLGGTLADYFSFRPNDFLKIEVIKWALENGKSFYALGGGRQNNDGLFQYKKSFFPKDQDVIFYTGRKIINHKLYKKLIKSIGIDKKTIPHLINDSNYFFPLYNEPKQ